MKNTMFKNTFLTLLLLMMLGSISVLSAQSKNFAGSWTSSGTSVRMEISFEGSNLKMAAIDDSDGEVLEVSNVEVLNSKTIKYTLHTPSTDFTVISTLNLKGKKKMIEILDNENQTELIFEKQGKSNGKE